MILAADMLCVCLSFRETDRWKKRINICSGEWLEYCLCFMREEGLRTVSESFILNNMLWGSEGHCEFYVKYFKGLVPLRLILVNFTGCAVRNSEEWWLIITLSDAFLNLSMWFLFFYFFYSLNPSVKIRFHKITSSKRLL